MEPEKQEKKTMSQRTKSIIIGVIGLASGVAIAAFIFNNKEDKDEESYNRYSVKPEHLQLMLDKPESVVFFKEARVFVGNSESTEVL